MPNVVITRDGSNDSFEISGSDSFCDPTNTPDAGEYTISIKNTGNLSATIVHNGNQETFDTAQLNSRSMKGLLQGCCLHGEKYTATITDGSATSTYPNLNFFTAKSNDDLILLTTLDV